MENLGGREKPWLRYDQISVDSTPLASQFHVDHHETEDAASTDYLDDGMPAKSPAFHQAHFTHGSAETRKRAHTSLTWWLPEILSQIGGMLCLLAIIILLWRADGHPPPNLKLGFTLNTILAFLVSLAKVAFLVPVIEGLGQLKWIWFLYGPRPLAEFQLFDEATRGGLGGLRLLFRFKGFLPSFGALIMLSGLMTSTLTQQAISYTIIQAVSQNGTATVDRATAFSTYDGHRLVITPYETAREQEAIFKGIFSAPTEIVPDVRPLCSSGECTWPPYSSLAICGDVANLTALGDTALLGALSNATEKRLAVLANTSYATSQALGYGAFYFASLPKVFPIVIGLLDKPSGAFNQSVTDLMLSDSFIAYTDEMMNNTVPATFDISKMKYLEVALWWCTKTYSTKVTGGQPETEELAAFSSLSSPAPTLNMPWSAEFYPCYTVGTCNDTYGGTMASLKPPPGVDAAGSSQDSYTIHVWTELVASALMAATMFDSILMDHTRGVIASNGGGVAKAFGLSLLGDFQSTESPPPEKQLANVRAVTTNLARSMTNTVRQGNTRLNKTDDSAVVTGTVFAPQAFVKVRWEWLTMLVAQLCLTAVFLILTMVITHAERMQIIKGSSLAAMCATDWTTRQHAGGLDDLDSLNQKAKDLKVKLERGNSGAALWLRMQRDAA